jgi:hypothetical protein
VSDIILTLDETEAARAAQQAKERGYDSVVDYVRALLAADAIVDVLRPDWETADESSEVIEMSLREALHEAMTGKVLPVESLWDRLDDEQ